MRLVTALFLLGLLAIPARADFIAGNFGPGSSYQTGTGNSWSVGDGTSSSVAVQFVNTTSTTYALTEFRFAANYFAGTNLLTVGFYGGSTDLNTATLLESFTFTAPDQFTDHIYTATSSLHPLITPGGTYFIAASVSGAPATNWGWQWNNQGQNDGWWARFGSAPWFAETGAVAPVFDVSGTATVPEPATLTLAVIGGVLAGGVGWVRRRQAKVA
jgi:hypothetical protein